MLERELAYERFRSVLARARYRSPAGQSMPAAGAGESREVYREAIENMTSRRRGGMHERRRPRGDELLEGDVGSEPFELGEPSAGAICLAANDTVNRNRL